MHSLICPECLQPSLFRKEQVEQARQQRAQQQQQQQMMAMGMAAAQGAKTLSEAKTSDPSVLSAMANAVSGQDGQSQ